MSIEFRCTHCDKLLTTQAGSEGQKAKCPQCGTLQVIPDASSPAAPEGVDKLDAPPPRDLGLAATQAHPQETANPYQSPSDDSTPPPVQRGFNPTQIDLGETFSTTWQIYKANLGACMAGTFLMIVCSSAVGGIGQVLLAIGGSNLDGGAFVTFWLLQQVVAQAINAFFFIGIILFMLRIARGESAEFGLLFAGGPFFVYGAALQIIVFLATLGGFILLIIPGVIIALMLSQVMFVLVDQRADIGSSLKLSVEIMKGNKLTVFAIGLVGGVVSVLITLFTCGIGLLFVLPFMMLIPAVIYLRVTGQKTAVDGGAGYGVERPLDNSGMQPT